MVKLIECPRDAMQGIEKFIDSEKKARYLNELLQVGFDTIDCGSFVSPKAIPQMKDTPQVLERLQLGSTATKLLAIVANSRGAKDASQYDEITYLGFPLSLSETFQQRNTNRSIDQAFDEVAEIQETCDSNDKELVVYLSMSFGNPYGDPYDVGYVEQFVRRLDELEISIISLADTVGVSSTSTISLLYDSLVASFPHLEFGAHLHSSRETSMDKIDAAFKSGCRRFDGAIRGFGGCPMAKDDLVGNIATEDLVDYFSSQKIDLELSQEAFEHALKRSFEIF